MSWIRVCAHFHRFVEYLWRVGWRAHNFLVMFASLQWLQWLHPKLEQPAFCPNLDPCSYQNETEGHELKFYLYHSDVHLVLQDVITSTIWVWFCRKEFLPSRFTISHGRLFGQILLPVIKWGLNPCYFLQPPEEEEEEDNEEEEEGHNPGYFLQPPAPRPPHLISLEAFRSQSFEMEAGEGGCFVRNICWSLLILWYYEKLFPNIYAVCQLSKKQITINIEFMYARLESVWCILNGLTLG